LFFWEAAYKVDKFFVFEHLSVLSTTVRPRHVSIQNVNMAFVKTVYLIYCADGQCEQIQPVC
jgi:hypothetical protein